MVQIANLEIADETGQLLANVARKRGQSVDDVVRSMLGAREPQSGATTRRDQSFLGTWALICELAGTEFRTRNGQRFSYRIEGDYVEPSTSDVRIPMSQFKKALAMGPVRGPSSLRGVFAPSLVWAIVNDVRVAEAIEKVSPKSNKAVHEVVDHRPGSGKRETESYPPVDAQLSRVHQTWPDDSAYGENEMPFKTIEPLREASPPVGVPLYPQNAHVWAIASALPVAEQESAEPEREPVEEVQAQPDRKPPEVSRINAAAMARLTQAGVYELQQAQAKALGTSAGSSPEAGLPVPMSAMADMTIAEVLKSTGQENPASDQDDAGAAAGAVPASEVQTSVERGDPSVEDPDRPEYALRSSALSNSPTPKLRGLFKRLFSTD